MISTRTGPRGVKLQTIASFLLANPLDGVVFIEGVLAEALDVIGTIFTKLLAG